jgi:hypothetical protein
MVDTVFKTWRYHMKKIALFFPLMVIMAGCGPSANDVDIAQAQGIIEAARAAQDAALAAQIAARGISDVGRGQTLILLMLTILVFILVALAVYLIVRRLAFRQNNFRRVSSGRWIGGPNAHWKKAAESDLYPQILLEQQLLLTQLLSQNQEETDRHDLSELPMDWWN